MPVVTVLRRRGLMEALVTDDNATGNADDSGGGDGSGGVGY